MGYEQPGVRVKPRSGEGRRCPREVRVSDETLENSGAAAAYQQSASRNRGDLPRVNISRNDRGMVLQQAIATVVVAHHRSIWKLLGTQINGYTL